MSSEKAGGAVKFADIALGAGFRWRECDYVKISPLIARDESTGASRMIQRAALVEPLAGVTAGSVAAPSQTEAVFEEYHRTVLACLEDVAANRPAEDIAQARRRLDEARRRALKKLAKAR